MATKQDIIKEIDENFNSYVEFLQSFIRAASPNPPGDTTKAAGVIVDFLSSHGITPDTIAPQSHMPNIVTDFNGGKGPGPRVILNGHIDAFPAGDPSKWAHGGPYSGFNDGTAIHGRGGVDMKAGTAASVIAYVLLSKHAEHLNGCVALTAVSDEETGGKWGTKFLLEGCGEPSPWKGDVVLNGEPGGLQSVRFGEKGTLRVTFEVRTKGGNGAYKHLSRGANIVAARLITRLLHIEEIESELPEELRKHFEDAEVRRVADEIMGPGAADILLKPTLNIGVINGGQKVNVIPEECVFEADIRLPIGLETSKVLDHITTVLHDFPEASFIIQEAASNPPNHCAVDHPFAKCIQRNAEEVTGVKPVMLVGIGGTDCKFWRYAGVPAYVFGPSPKGMGATGERVGIEEFAAVVKTHVLAVWELLGGGE